MSARKSIAFLKNHLGGKEGGLEKHTWRLTEAFKKEGYDITLCTSSPIEHSSFETIQIPINRFSSAQKICSFDKGCSAFLKNRPFDIVFGLDRNSYQTHLRAGNGVHAAFLNLRKQHESFFKNLSFSINPLHRCLLQIEKKAFENPDLRVLLTNSHMVKAQVQTCYKIDPAKIQTVHNGVEWYEKKNDFDNWATQKPHILEYYGLPKNTFHFIFVGHDFKRKGLKNLLKALSLIKRSDFFLSIIGKDKNELYFRELAKNLGLSSKVRFFGNCENVTPFYQIADLLVIPSFYDPFANVTIEALAMGNSIITSTSNGAHEILQPFSGHILNNLSDIEEFADTLEKAMEFPKTISSALQIRESVKYLDFENQLPKIVSLCLN